MALFETILSVLALIVVVFLGIKIIKNAIVTLILVIALIVFLYYFGYLIPI